MTVDSEGDNEIKEHVGDYGIYSLTRNQLVAISELHAALSCLPLASGIQLDSGNGTIYVAFLVSLPDLKDSLTSVVVTPITTLIHGKPHLSEVEYLLEMVAFNGFNIEHSWPNSSHTKIAHIPDYADYLNDVLEAHSN